MLYFDYNPKEITEKELESKTKELFANCDFQPGDNVKMKGDINSPTMSVTDIDIKNQNIMYDKFSRRYIQATCKWFNKSRQDFTSTNLSVLCLEKR